MLYEPKAGHDAADAELLEPLEFLARVLIHIPEPNKHLLHYFGAYAHRVLSTPPVDSEADEDEPSPQRRAVRKRWAELIFRIYEVDPLTCRRCGAQMKILAFITEHAVIRRILDHLDKKASRPRAPAPTRPGSLPLRRFPSSAGQSS